MDKKLTIIVGIMFAMVLILFGVAVAMLLRDSGSENSAEPNGSTNIVADSGAAGSTDSVAVPTAVSTVAPINPTLPPPAVDTLPTLTSVPTSTPTETPIPTNTPEPTATPIPPTNTPVPVYVPPPATNTPVPPPPPPPPPPAPAGVAGISASWFALQDRSQFGSGQSVWFEFTIFNSSANPVPYGCLGVMPNKDGGDRTDYYQHSYGSGTSEMPANGLEHVDNIKIPEGGGYTLRLVMSFDDINVCKGGGGTWHTLSQSIPVTIN